MSKIKLNDDVYKQLRILASQNIYLEGNILKVIDTSDLDEDNLNYINKAKEIFKDKSAKTYKHQKSVLDSNKELEYTQKELQEALESAQDAKEEAIISNSNAQRAKEKAEADLDIIQKKTQSELMKIVTRTALYIIIAIVIMTFVLYLFNSIKGEKDDTLSNLISTIFISGLSSSFSTIALILGIRESLKTTEK